MFKKGFFISLFTLMFSAMAMAHQMATPVITQPEVQSLMATPDSSKFVILDVRTADEFNQEHIPGAINLSHDLIEDNIAKIIEHKDKLVIVHCRSGRRAAFAENILREKGFKNLQHLEGDMNGWKKANLPTVANQ